MSEDLRPYFYKLATNIYVDINKPEPPIPVYAVFYTLMSQYFNKCTIKMSGELKSLKLSFLLILMSGTGKGQLAKVGDLTAKSLGIRSVTVTDITEAGLVGTIDERALDYNHKHKLKIDDKDYKDPIILGDLFNYDIIWFREAKKLLVPTKNTEMLLTTLQEALDNDGYVRKKLRNKIPVEGYCNCSIFGTTYMLKEIEKILVEQGFFRRVPIYIKEFSNEKIRQLRKNVINMYDSDNTQKEFEKDLSKFASLVKKIDNSARTLNLDKSALKVLNNNNDKFCDLMNTVTGDKLNIMRSLSQTIIDISIKIGAIHALLENKTVINSHHISMSWIFVKSCVDTILNKIEITENNVDSTTRSIKKIISFYRLTANDRKINMFPKSDFTLLLKEKFNYGRNKSLNLINTMIRDNYFNVIKDGKTIYIKLNESA